MTCDDTGVCGARTNGHFIVRIFFHGLLQDSRARCVCQSITQICLTALSKQVSRVSDGPTSFECLLRFSSPEFLEVRTTISELADDSGRFYRRVTRSHSDCAAWIAFAIRSEKSAVFESNCSDKKHLATFESANSLRPDFGAQSNSQHCRRYEVAMTAAAS